MSEKLEGERLAPLERLARGAIGLTGILLRYLELPSWLSMSEVKEICSDVLKSMD